MLKGCKLPPTGECPVEGYKDAAFLQVSQGSSVGRMFGGRSVFRAFGKLGKLMKQTGGLISTASHELPRIVLGAVVLSAVTRVAQGSMVGFQETRRDVAPIHPRQVSRTADGVLQTVCQGVLAKESSFKEECRQRQYDPETFVDIGCSHADVIKFCEDIFGIEKAPEPSGDVTVVEEETFPPYPTERQCYDSSYFMRKVVNVREPGDVRPMPSSCSTVVHAGADSFSLQGLSPEESVARTVEWWRADAGNIVVMGCEEQIYENPVPENVAIQRKTDSGPAHLKLKAYPHYNSASAYEVYDYVLRRIRSDLIDHKDLPVYNIGDDHVTLSRNIGPSVKILSKPYTVPRNVTAECCPSMRIDTAVVSVVDWPGGQNFKAAIVVKPIYDGETLLSRPVKAILSVNGICEEVTIIEDLGEYETHDFKIDVGPNSVGFLVDGEELHRVDFFLDGDMTAVVIVTGGGIPKNDTRRISLGYGALKTYDVLTVPHDDTNTGDFVVDGPCLTPLRFEQDCDPRTSVEERLEPYAFFVYLAMFTAIVAIAAIAEIGKRCKKRPENVSTSVLLSARPVEPPSVLEEGAVEFSE